MIVTLSHLTQNIDTLYQAIDEVPANSITQTLPEMGFIMKGGIILLPVVILTILAIYIIFERYYITKHHTAGDAHANSKRYNQGNIPNFDDLIFESLNKEYGAYFLRKRYNYYLAISTFVAIFIACSAIIVPFRIAAKSYSKIAADARRVIQVQMDAFVPPEEKILLPPPPAPPTAGMAKQIRYLPPEIVDTIITEASALVTTEEALEYSGDTTVVEPISSFGDFSLDGEGVPGGDEPFIIVEEMPAFMGGDLNSFRQWVQKRAIYPQEAADNDIKGKVMLGFIIERDGSVSNITVVKGVHPLLDEEAIRVVSSSPKWKPGIQRGHPVRVRYTMPIIFQFQ